MGKKPANHVLKFKDTPSFKDAFKIIRPTERASIKNL